MKMIIGINVSNYFWKFWP